MARLVQFRAFRKSLSPVVIAFGLTLSTLGSFETSAQTSSLERRVTVNQIGYAPSGPKRAVLFGVPQDKSVEVGLLNAQTHKLVQTLKSGKSRFDKDSKTFVADVDFSAFESSGNFVLAWNGLVSHPFRIAENHLRGPLTTMLRSYYLQRCGVNIDSSLTAAHRPACHLEDGLTAREDERSPAQSPIPASGGWHDAGDYGKYVATTAVTTGQLLSLYEHMPHTFAGLNLNIPESNNELPDILDEIKVGLDWMLTMQRVDGAVYRKLSGAKWPKLIAPEDDHQTRYVYGISTPETAKFAATMAQAGRIYRRHNDPSAAGYLAAARRAWDYLSTRKDQYIDTAKGDNSGSGPYVASKTDRESALTHDRDDRLWAAAELYLTTNEAQYHRVFSRLAKHTPYTMFEWKDPSSLGLLSYILNQKAGKDEALAKVFVARLLERADTVLNAVQSHPLGLANHRFVWGSNKMTAQGGVTLAFAYLLTYDQRYLRAAARQLDYLFGANAFDKSFVTGLGANPVRHVSHIFVRAHGIDVPGLLVGGPNELAQAGIAPKNSGALSYADDARSYATNEYAIDYNGTLITLMSLLSSILSDKAMATPSS